MNPPAAAAATEVTTPPHQHHGRQRRGAHLVVRILIFAIIYDILSLLKLEPLTHYVVQDHKSLPRLHSISISHRYYIYNLPEDLILMPHRTPDVIWSIYKALQVHPLRTFDPNKATFFIPPIFAAYANDRYQRNKFFRAMELVTSSGIYQSTLGSRHILIDNGGWSFNWQTVTGLHMDIKFYTPEWAKNYSQPGWFKNYSQWQNNVNEPCNHDLLLSCITSVFKNNILARERDMWALRTMHLNKVYSGDFNDLVSKHDPIPSYGFSFGFLDDHNVPLQKPSYSKYKKSDLIFFYHTRREPPFFCNSTIYRHAPMTQLPTNGTEEQLTFLNSSIGFDIERKDWIDRISKSKFCLVTRGDDPMSRALMRSIRIGCIPVVVSDLLHVYSPSFKSTLNFSDYSIMVDEKDFIADPWGTLHRVYYRLTENEVKRKLNAIAFAQRVIFADHPESLFVPAFLKEAWQSIPVSERSVGCGSSGTKKCHE